MNAHCLAAGGLLLPLLYAGRHGKRRASLMRWSTSTIMRDATTIQRVPFLFLTD